MYNQSSQSVIKSRFQSHLSFCRTLTDTNKLTLLQDTPMRQRSSQDRNTNSHPTPAKRSKKQSVEPTTKGSIKQNVGIGDRKPSHSKRVQVSKKEAERTSSKGGDTSDSNNAETKLEAVEASDDSNDRITVKPLPDEAGCRITETHRPSSPVKPLKKREAALKLAKANYAAVDPQNNTDAKPKKDTLTRDETVDEGRKSRNHQHSPSATDDKFRPAKKDDLDEKDKKNFNLLAHAPPTSSSSNRLEEKKNILAEKLDGKDTKDLGQLRKKDSGEGAGMLSSARNEATHLKCGSLSEKVRDSRQEEVEETVGGKLLVNHLFFFLRDFIFKKTLFEKLQYLKQEQSLLACLF